MALADREVKPDTRSAFEKWLDTLNDKNRKTVETWLRNPEIGERHLIVWLREDDPEDDFNGVRVSRDTLLAWRRANGVKP